MHATEFVRSYFDAWNHCDAKGVADHFAADGIYRDIPQNAQCSHDEVSNYVIGLFSNHRHRYELIGNILMSRNTIAYQYRACPVEEPGVSEMPNAYRGAEFVTLHGDAAITITDYYDNPDTRQVAHRPELTPGKASTNRYAKSGLNSEQMHEYKYRLEQIMRSQKVFLMPDLTLPTLANAVNCSVNHLSQVINSGFGLSFFDYVNQFRIEFARDLLSRLDSRGTAILNIAFAVGFNSNSAFYAAFKKRVGQTPAQYRRQQLQKLYQ